VFDRKYKIRNLLVALSVILSLTACNLPSRQPAEPEVTSLLGSAEAPTLNPDADRDPCLDGDWIMPTADLDLFVASLVPIPNIRVVGGSLQLSFADGAYNYSGEFTLQIDLDTSQEQYMQTDALFSSGGAYATEIRSERDFPVFTFLIFDLTVSDSNELVWRAYKEGDLQTMPGSGPSFTILPPGEAPYKCTDTQLEIGTQGPGGPLTMFFQR
jgi:hypothetical protein